MPAAPVALAEREPRRARYLIPRDLPRRGEVIAALTAFTFLGHLLFAQLTMVLAIMFQATSRLSRWRPQWLAVPAAAGVVWVLALGPGSALAGFTAGPRAVAGYLARTAQHPTNVVHLSVVFAGAGHWLARQLPLALIVAAGEAAVAWWLRWLHTDEQDLPPARAGFVILAGRRLRGASVAAGGVVTREGACLGIVPRTGQRAAVSWPEAERGMLCTGSSAAAAAATSFQVAHAAIRRRKPVIAVDLAGTPGLAESLAVVCEAAAAPLRTFGPSGPGYYEPLRGGDPARKTALVMGMVDWGDVAEYARRTCGGYLNDLFAVAAAAPADPAVPVLDDVVHLLNPAALRARVQRVPPYHPRRGPLAERVRVSASLLRADPGPAAFLAEQLTGLRASPLGRWLRPDPASGQAPSAGISLSGIVRDRAVALFSLDQAAHGRSAAMIANLVALDATAAFAESQRHEIGGDGLAWFGPCDAVDASLLGGLVSTGAQAGLATLFDAVSAEAAGRVAGLVNVLVIHRLDDPALAGRLALLTSAPSPPGGPGALAAGGRAGHGVPGVPGLPGIPGAGAALGARAAQGTRARPAGSHAQAAFPAAQVPGTGLTGRDDPAGAPGADAAGSPVAGAPLISAAALCHLGDDEFTLAVKGPVRRVEPACRFISGGPR
jgi:hypothetical protein